MSWFFVGTDFFSPKSSNAKYKTQGTSEANFRGKKPRIILREVRYANFCFLQRLSFIFGFPQDCDLLLPTQTTVHKKWLPAETVRVILLPAETLSWKLNHRAVSAGSYFPSTTGLSKKQEIMNSLSRSQICSNMTIAVYRGHKITIQQHTTRHQFPMKSEAILTEAMLNMMVSLKTIGQHLLVLSRCFKALSIGSSGPSVILGTAGANRFSFINSRKSCQKKKKCHLEYR